MNQKETLLNLEKEIVFMPLYFDDEYLMDIEYNTLLILTLKISEGKIDYDRVYLLNKENGDKVTFNKKGFMLNPDSNILVNNITDIIKKKFQSKKETTEFKIGDIVVSLEEDDFISKITGITNLGNILFNSPSAYNKDYFRLANKDEIIKYYENQGWVKGAKFRCNCDKICREEKEPFIIEKLSVKNYNDVFITYLTEWGYTSSSKIKDCELIKESDYPKSWDKLKDIDKKADCEILSAQEVCFRRLQDLHKVMIDEYNRINNCDWKPNWNNQDISISRIIRCYDYLIVAFEQTNVYHHLVFPTRELAEFSLKNHKDLWEQYYQL